MTASEILSKLDEIKADIQAWAECFDKRLTAHDQQLKDIKQRLEVLEEKQNGKQ